MYECVYEYVCVAMTVSGRVYVCRHVYVNESVVYMFV